MGIFALDEAMLRASGFEIETRAEDEVYICRTAEMPYQAYGPGAVYPLRG
jgi:tRNA (mo5U34)-methyltransferase